MIVASCYGLMTTALSQDESIEIAQCNVTALLSGIKKREPGSLFSTGLTAIYS
jgi:hypothetical protein